MEEQMLKFIEAVIVILALDMFVDMYNETRNEDHRENDED